MVGEFPELQGVMGRYYALHDGEDRRSPTPSATITRRGGPADAVPTAPVSIAVALADKLDQLAGFFAIGEKPTGSGDPYALRRAALGVIRIIRENGAAAAPASPLIDAPLASGPGTTTGVRSGRQPHGGACDFLRSNGLRGAASRRGRAPRRADRGVRRRRG